MLRKNLNPQEKPLDKAERQLLREIEAGEWISDPDFPAQKSHFEQTARKTLTKSERISIRLTKADLDALKLRAAREGLPYQTLIGSVLHKYVTDQFVTTMSRPKAIEH